MPVASAASVVRHPLRGRQRLARDATVAETPRHQAARGAGVVAPSRDRRRVPDHQRRGRLRAGQSHQRHAAPADPACAGAGRPRPPRRRTDAGRRGRRGAVRVWCSGLLVSTATWPAAAPRPRPRGCPDRARCGSAGARRRSRGTGPARSGVGRQVRRGQRAPHEHRRALAHHRPPRPRATAAARPAPRPAGWPNRPGPGGSRRACRPGRRRRAFTMSAVRTPSRLTVGGPRRWRLPHGHARHRQPLLASDVEDEPGDPLGGGVAVDEKTGSPMPCSAGHQRIVAPQDHLVIQLPVHPAS